MKTSAHPPVHGQRGVALVVTLFFLVILTVAVVGLLDSSRMERTSARSHLERERATNMAQHGVEMLVATLQRETTDNARMWISGPGSLSVPQEASKNLTKLERFVDLSSGRPSAEPGDTVLDPILAPANLNVRTFADSTPPTYLLLNPDPSQPASTESPDGAPLMAVRWIYVRKAAREVTYPDGTKAMTNFDFSEQPDLRDTSNPIIGRFAYWADDESAKVNYNLAWARTTQNTFPSGHQTKVDLRALPIGNGLFFTAPMADALHTAITPDKYFGTVNRFFNSPYDARHLGEAVPGLRSALDLNRFNLTHYNSDPDTTYYGKPRMMLTTQFKNAVIRDKDGRHAVGPDGKKLVRPFLDILKRTDSDTYVEPGLVANVDSATPGPAGAGKLDIVVRTLIEDYLKRTDWPVVDGTGASVQSKYFAAYSAGTVRDQRLAQIALNIIDYVRCAESTMSVVEPLRGIWQGGGFVSDATSSSIAGREDTFKGLTRGLHITEIGLWISTTAETTGSNRNRYPAIAFVEVLLPANYGIDSLDLGANRWQVWFGSFPGSGNVFRGRSGGNAVTETIVDYWPSLTSPPGSSQWCVWEALRDPSKMVIKSGEYRVFAAPVWSTKPAGDPYFVGGKIPLRAAITLVGSTRRIDVAPLSTSSNGALPLECNVSSSPATHSTFTLPIQSVESNDPRVNGVAPAWKRVAVSTFGNPNRSTTVGAAPGNVVPEQDTDAAGKISSASMRMPYPKGHKENPNGRVRSPGELGLIHTGIEGSSRVVVDGQPFGGVPWRSLRLQPSSQGSNVVPDWAFTDLFTVPVDVPQAASVVFAPNSTSTGGRVNMNAHPTPFKLDRKDPLVAVLLNCRKSTASTETLTIAQARVIADNIYNRKRAKKGKRYPNAAADPSLTTVDVYESPGEVTEIEGVADLGEESEELMREIGNLITARGNVFSVYTVGQALKQTPTGKLIVTGEQRQQAYIERFQDTNGTLSETDDEVRLRTVYFRNLTP